MNHLSALSMASALSAGANSMKLCGISGQVLAFVEQGKKRLCTAQNPALCSMVLVDEYNDVISLVVVTRT